MLSQSPEGLGLPAESQRQAGKKGFKILLLERKRLVQMWLDVLEACKLPAEISSKEEKMM